ncbi:MAG: hypothetical protein H6553_12280 [Chitinophagales bacterium]|nr:hypothetical protein [Chitinophagales bacterium]
MRNLFLLIVITLITIKVQAQNDTLVNNMYDNNIIIFKDPRVDVLEKFYRYKKTVAEKLIRVHVFQATNRDEVFNAKKEFSARFPGIETFMSYQSPNFKLRAGTFATTKEAQNFLKQVKPYFPSSFVIEEKIKQP